MSCLRCWTLHSAPQRWHCLPMPQDADWPSARLAIGFGSELWPRMEEDPRPVFCQKLLEHARGKSSSSSVVVLGWPCSKALLPPALLWSSSFRPPTNTRAHTSPPSQASCRPGFRHERFFSIRRTAEFRPTKCTLASAPLAAAVVSCASLPLPSSTSSSVLPSSSLSLSDPPPGPRSSPSSRNTHLLPDWRADAVGVLCFRTDSPRSPATRWPKDLCRLITSCARMST
ncbi:hypothetical protein QBC47DRAFT_123285 [Echria macrotheca]|uniref:Uncharacterized protein n=1 Tax=Echria macrotheca TaxID=438768 RepID=A0AAJ0F1R0_9PEZI|nr:hypothetical protein QBC47DRAFT_123285 [Echria macrotheca]